MFRGRRLEEIYRGTEMKFSRDFLETRNDKTDDLLNNKLYFCCDAFKCLPLVNKNVYFSNVHVNIYLDTVTAVHNIIIL